VLACRFGVAFLAAWPLLQIDVQMTSLPRLARPPAGLDTGVRAWASRVPM